MGIGTSIVVFAVGAVLDFAISIRNSHGFNLHTIGVILMVVGAIGFVISLFFWGSWGGFGRRDVVVDRGPVGRRRRVIDDEIV
jgi:hypothetical protein